MKKPVRIAPSILSADFASLGAEISAISDAGADWIHVDVMDGHFVPNITIGPAVVKAIRKKTTLPFDIHLMISPVDPYIKEFAAAGADTFVAGSAIFNAHQASDPHGYDSVIQRMRAELAKVR